MQSNKEGEWVWKAKGKLEYIMRFAYMRVVRIL